MNTRLNPYIGFRDTAKQAGQFDQSMFGGELTISTFGRGGTRGASLTARFSPAGRATFSRRRRV